MIGLTRYENTIRWKEHFLIKNYETSNETPETVSDNSSVETINLSINSANSLNTRLKPKNKCMNAPPGTPALEDFFEELKAILFKRLDQYYDKRINKKRKTLALSDINKLLENLRKARKVAVPTDRKKSLKIIEIEDYKS